MLIIVLLLYEKVNFIFPIKSYKVLKNSIVSSRFEFTSVVGWPFESVDKSVTIQMKAAVVTQLLRVSLTIVYTCQDHVLESLKLDSKCSKMPPKFVKQKSN